MKNTLHKKMLTLGCVSLLVINLLPVTIFANTKININLEGRLLTQTQEMGFAYLNNEYNRTMVPLRLVSEQLGYQVKWDGKLQTATIIENGTTVNIAIGSQSPTVNGVKKTIDAPAILKNGRTYVPVRFISEAMGEIVDYKNSTVYIGGGVKLPTVPSINGKATYDFSKDSKVLMEYLGINQATGTSGPVYVDEHTREPKFSVTPGQNGSLVEIYFYRWPQQSSLEFNPEVFGKHLGTVKEVLKFYLPNGYEKLYTILDEGFNDRLADSNSYLNKDLKNIIGSDGKKVEIAIDNNLYVRISK